MTNGRRSPLRQEARGERRRSAGLSPFVRLLGPRRHYWRLNRSCDAYGEQRREYNDDRDERPASHIALLFVGSHVGMNVAHPAGARAPEQQCGLAQKRSVRPAETPQSAAPSVSPLVTAPVSFSHFVTLNSAPPRSSTGSA